MPEQPSSAFPTATRVQASLHELAQLLRSAHHLEPEAQQALADLVEEMSQSLARAEVPSAEMAHLAASAGQLSQALHQQHDTRRLRERLEEVALRAETEAPVTAGIVRRLLDTLTNLGI